VPFRLDIIRISSSSQRKQKKIIRISHALPTYARARLSLILSATRSMVYELMLMQQLGSFFLNEYA
jgi:hypothetical protein